MIGPIIDIVGRRTGFLRGEATVYNPHRPQAGFTPDTKRPYPYRLQRKAPVDIPTGRKPVYLKAKRP